MKPHPNGTVLGFTGFCNGIVRRLVGSFHFLSFVSFSIRSASDEMRVVFFRFFSFFFRFFNVKKNKVFERL